MSKNRFQKQLHRSVIIKIFVLIVIGIASLVFTTGLQSYFSHNENSDNTLDMLQKSYLEQKSSCTDLLEDEEILLATEQLLSGKISNDEYRIALTRKLGDCPIETEALVTDENNILQYYSDENASPSNAMLGYNGAICYKANNETDEDEIYQSIYFGEKEYSDPMFVRKIYEGDDLKGFLTLYVSGSAWNYDVAEQNYDGVVTDSSDNIIFCSKSRFISAGGKFRAGTGFYYQNEDQRYWMKSEELDDGTVLYALIYYPVNNSWILIVVIICVLGLSWLFIANSMSDSMAAYNSARIEKLTNEIRHIKHGRPEYRVVMNTNDEYEEVAKQINAMLDSIKDLNDKNIELIQLNNTFEMNELLAEINPHFLYNTLEMIMSMTTQDPKKTEELIVKLTRILRYSMNRDMTEVMLEEDIDYLEDYIYIQKCRFGDRLKIQFNLEPECMQCLVPKLILQPIIENSLKYGFRNQMNVLIDVEGHVEGNVLKMTVTDNGPGVSPERCRELNEQINKPNETTSSFGLHNISRRLYLLYGEHSGLEIRSEEGKSLTVIISVEVKNCIA